MCGIVAIARKDRSAERPVDVFGVLMDSLVELQNRGYDSVGVGYFDPTASSRIQIKKTCDFTEDSLRALVPSGDHRVAIGHTRWATHGRTVEANAHPHISMHNLFAVVHNGIIENFAELRLDLVKNGYRFSSETDTEVVAHMLEDEYTNNNAVTIVGAIQNVCARLVGTYGLAILCADSDSVFVTRRGSPLLVSENDDICMATSETAGFVNCMRHYRELKPGVVARLDASGIDVFDSSPNPQYSLAHTSFLLPATTLAGDLGDCNHWVQKEIYEQDRTLVMSINNGARIANGVHLGGLDVRSDRILEARHVLLLGCGSSLYACECARGYFQRLVMDSVTVRDGAELTDQDVRDGTVVVLCSQSGETKDMQRCLDIVSSKQTVTVGVINVVDSSIARSVDCGVYMNVGREIGVASTKSFTASVLILYMIASWMRARHGSVRASGASDIIYSVVGGVKTLLARMKSERLIERYRLASISKPSLFILGKGRLEFIAKEAALKFKEMCYIHAEGYNGSALKHGPFALIEPNFPIIMLIDRQNRTKMMNAYNEVVSRGASVLVLTDCDDLCVPENISVLRVGEGSYDLHEIHFAVALQAIAYEVAYMRNVNPDRPRNLAKVVTVE